MEQNFEEINNDLKNELINEILNKDSDFFEDLVLELLKKMGYGINSRKTSKTIDGGIDGIIDEDILGFSKIYIQAKRYDADKGSMVSKPKIQEFVGALSDKKTYKGLFITTAFFSKEAKEYAQNLQSHSIALVDRDKLAELLIEYELGVQVKDIKKIYKIDTDFFDK